MVHTAAEGSSATEARSGNPALGFEVDQSSRMARSYPLSAVVGNDEIKEVLHLNEEETSCKGRQVH